MTEETAAAVMVVPRGPEAAGLLEEHEGPVHREERSPRFVATGFNQQVCPSAWKGSGCPIPAIDPKAVQDLAALAVQVATQVEELLRSVQGALQALTTLSVGCIQTYRDGVESLGDAVDTSIRSMYTLMARCEELDLELQPVPALARRIRDMKSALDRLEGLCK
ncbi:BLOC-1-related complex subunit 6 [Liasis olivaceus]